MNQLHDSHTIPEPILVLSGLTFIFPAYTAYTQQKYYFSGSLAFLSFTTVGYHGTRNETLFILDLIAITNYILTGGVVTYYKTPREQIPYILSIVYCIISYFVGRQYKLFSFDPDWNTQMFFHSLMHLFPSYTAIKYLES